MIKGHVALYRHPNVRVQLQNLGLHRDRRNWRNPNGGAGSKGSPQAVSVRTLDGRRTSVHSIVQHKAVATTEEELEPIPKASLQVGRARH